MDQLLQLLKDVFAAKGIRRVLWSFLVLAMLGICFETQTNYFEISAITRRLDALEKASKEPLPIEQEQRIEKLKGGILEELEAVQVKREHPFSQLGRIVVRFLKGAWVTLPLFLFVIGFSFLLLKQNRAESLQVRGMMLYLFGWLGLSAVAWLTTLLGIISAIWNTSQSFLISWVVFPFCSATICTLVVGWVKLLRALLPKPEAKPAASTQNQCLTPQNLGNEAAS